MSTVVNKKCASGWERNEQRQSRTAKPQHVSYQRTIVDRDLRDELNTMLIPLQLENGVANLEQLILEPLFETDRERALKLRELVNLALILLTKNTF